MVTYNELEPYAASWLRNLSDAGHIAQGYVDDRSIHRLSPAEAGEAAQFHAFAGVGAWSYALRLAGWPDDRPVWTGSCPCQPFSVAGKGRGTADERHLWPEWFRLIRECRPPVVFGEQVASAAGLAWLDAVRADLEGEGYAVGAADLCAAGVGAPHIRQRLYFGAVRLADAGGTGLPHAQPPHVRGAGRREERGAAEQRDVPPTPWDAVKWLDCRDGRRRPTQPGLRPLVDGAPARVGRLRAYGNAIVPQVAAAFITAFLDAIGEDHA